MNILLMPYYQHRKESGLWGLNHIPDLQGFVEFLKGWPKRIVPDIKIHEATLLLCLLCSFCISNEILVDIPEYTNFWSGHTIW